MQRYRLNSDLNVVGGFWQPNNQTEIFAGTLSSEGRRLYLSVSPTIKKLDTDEMVKAFSGVNGSLQRLEVLCGDTAAGHPCTLLGMMETTGAGCLDFANGLEIKADRWRVGAAVMGLCLDSAESESIDHATFYFSKINKFLPVLPRLAITDEHFTFSAPRRGLPFFEFSSLALGAEVTCKIFFRSSGLKSVPQMRVVPRTPKSLDWFHLIGLRLENFFSMFLGTSVALTSLGLRKGKDDGWLVQNIPFRKEKVSLQSWVRCEPYEIARALAIWLAVPEEQQPVERTVLGMVRKSSLFMEAEFLGLAQALEGFGRLRFESGLIDADEFKNGLSKLKEELHRIWGKSEIAKRCSDSLSGANESSYRHRLGLTYDMLTVPFAVQLLGERSEFLTRVVQTRNYFTHLGIKKGTAVTEGGKELFALNQKLHALLRCVMLLDLGISEERLKNPILYQTQRWK
jgi:hypothetical protein